MIAKRWENILLMVTSIVCRDSTRLRSGEFILSNSICQTHDGLTPEIAIVDIFL